MIHRERSPLYRFDPCRSNLDSAYRNVENITRALRCSDQDRKYQARNC